MFVEAIPYSELIDGFSIFESIIDDLEINEIPIKDALEKVPSFILENILDHVAIKCSSHWNVAHTLLNRPQKNTKKVATLKKRMKNIVIKSANFGKAKDEKFPVRQASEAMLEEDFEIQDNVTILRVEPKFKTASSAAVIIEKEKNKEAKKEKKEDTKEVKTEIHSNIAKIAVEEKIESIKDAKNGNTKEEKIAIHPDIAVEAILESIKDSKNGNTKEKKTAIHPIITKIADGAKIESIKDEKKEKTREVKILNDSEINKIAVEAKIEGIKDAKNGNTKEEKASMNGNSKEEKIAIHPNIKNSEVDLMNDNQTNAEISAECPKNAVQPVGNEKQKTLFQSIKAMLGFGNSPSIQVIEPVVVLESSPIIDDPKSPSISSDPTIPNGISHEVKRMTVPESIDSMPKSQHGNENVPLVKSLYEKLNPIHRFALDSIKPLKDSTPESIQPYTRAAALLFGSVMKYKNEVAGGDLGKMWVELWSDPIMKEVYDEKALDQLKNMLTPEKAAILKELIDSNSLMELFNFIYGLNYPFGRGLLLKEEDEGTLTNLILWFKILVNTCQEAESALLRTESFRNAKTSNETVSRPPKISTWESTFYVAGKYLANHPLLGKGLDVYFPAILDLIDSNQEMAAAQAQFYITVGIKLMAGQAVEVGKSVQEHFKKFESGRATLRRPHCKPSVSLPALKRASAEKAIKTVLPNIDWLDPIRLDVLSDIANNVNSINDIEAITSISEALATAFGSIMDLKYALAEEREKSESDLKPKSNERLPAAKNRVQIGHIDSTNRLAELKSSVTQPANDPPAAIRTAWKQFFNDGILKKLLSAKLIRSLASLPDTWTSKKFTSIQVTLKELPINLFFDYFTASKFPIKATIFSQTPSKTAWNSLDPHTITKLAYLASISINKHYDLFTKKLVTRPKAKVFLSNRKPMARANFIKNLTENLIKVDSQFNYTMAHRTYLYLAKLKPYCLAAVEGLRTFYPVVKDTISSANHSSAEKTAMIFFTQLTLQETVLNDSLSEKLKARMLNNPENKEIISIYLQMFNLVSRTRAASISDLTTSIEAIKKDKSQCQDLSIRTQHRFVHALATKSAQEIAKLLKGMAESGHGSIYTTSK